MRATNFLQSFPSSPASYQVTKEESMTRLDRPQVSQFELKGFVYCPICTHTVEGTVVSNGKTAKVKPGQKCSRCSASLDPGYIMRLDRAA
jgi:hypothetical protein